MRLVFGLCLSLAINSTMALASNTPIDNQSNTMNANSTVDNGQGIKTVNVRVNAMGLVTDVVPVLLVDFKLSDRITLGPQLGYHTYRSDSDFDVSGYSIGARMNIMLTGHTMADGLSLNPYILYGVSTLSNFGSVYSSLSTSTSSLDASAGGLGAGALASYQWVFKSGFNTNVGAGYGLFYRECSHLI